MALLKRKIEDRSISALQNVIDEHPTMEGYINKRDKELSWDGYIRLYQRDDDTTDKSNYDDDVPVQIKGHVDKTRKFMDKERITCPVDLEDLTVYYRKLGCLYFVMFMTEDGSEVEIFYSSLYPSKIKLYLEEAKRKGNRSSITIPFLKLVKDSKELYLLCKQFSFEIRKQGSGLGQIVPRAINGSNIERIQRITATTIGGTLPYDLLKRINTGDTVLYGSVDNSGIQYPIQMSQIVASVKQDFKTPLRIGNKEYYSSFEMESTVTSPDVKNFVRDVIHVIRPSQNISLTFHGPNIKFSIKPNTDILQLKRDAEFILALINQLEITIFDKKIPVGIKFDKDLLDQLHWIIEAGQVLEDVGCNILIPFKKLTDEDRAQIDFLCKIKTGKIKFNTDQKVFQYVWSFREKRWPIVVDIREMPAKIYEYIFNTKFCFSLGSPYGQTTATLSEDAYIVPNFLRTPPDLLANLLSYDYESMYEQLDRTVYNEYTADDLNGMALNLIAAYDICKNKKMLDVAAEVLNKLSVTFPDVVIYPINLCQIEVRRDGYLSEESLKKLKELNSEAALIPAPDNDEQTNVRRVFYYCAAVVKGDIEEADLLYSQLSDAEKKGVDDWPIHTLHLQLRNGDIPGLTAKQPDNILIQQEKTPPKFQTRKIHSVNQTKERSHSSEDTDAGVGECKEVKVNKS